MKTFVLDMKKGDLTSDGKLSEAGRARAREQLLDKLKAAMEGDIGPTPEGKEDVVRKALMEKIDQALGDALEGAGKTTIAQLSLKTMLDAAEGAQDMLAGIPDGILLLARAMAGDGISAKTIFELGEAAAQITIASATLHVAQRNLRHLMECECSPVSDKSEADAKTDTTTEAAATA